MAAPNPGNPDTPAQRVFVYGSLRRGQSHHRLLGDAPFLGTHTTEPVFTMLDLGPYPGVVCGGVTAVVGEVYAIGYRMLERLDQWEDYPLTYDRRRISTRYGDAWIYLYRSKDSDADTVASGDWVRR